MKKTFLYLCFALSLLVAGCGPSKQDQEKQKKKEDSLMEIERNNALGDADKILKQADSLDKIKQDSVKAAEKTVKPKDKKGK